MKKSCGWANDGGLYKKRGIWASMQRGHREEPWMMEPELERSVFKPRVTEGCWQHWRLERGKEGSGP
jgi:hypothetical protein